jgi:hypothetical protein
VQVTNNFTPANALCMYMFTIKLGHNSTERSPIMIIYRSAIIRIFHWQYRKVQSWNNSGRDLFRIILFIFIHWKKCPWNVIDGDVIHALALKLKQTTFEKRNGTSWHYFNDWNFSNKQLKKWNICLIVSAAQQAFTSKYIV